MTWTPYINVQQRGESHKGGNTRRKGVPGAWSATIWPIRATARVAPQGE